MNDTEPGAEASDRPAAPTLATVAAVFLRLGATSFGGPAAHVALMEDEFVERRRWLTRRELLDLIGASNLIPGPNSTELAIHIGYKVAGFKGLLVAGCCFIAPAALIVWGLAWAYVNAGKLPPVAGVLYGIKPVVIAIVAQALWRLGKTCLTSWSLAALGFVCLLLATVGVHELIVLLGGGAVMAVARWCRARPKAAASGPMLSAAIPAVPTILLATTPTTPFSLGMLFLIFLKVGGLLFGSGYVLLAFLKADLVERTGWLSEQQLLDAIAVGQVTPGPVFTTATFIGYLLHGSSGAVTATVAIFLPAFLFVAASLPILAQLQQSVVARGFLDGVNVASLALMFVVTWILGRVAIVDSVTFILAALSTALLLHSRLNSMWLILAGALVGLLRVVFVS